MLMATVVRLVDAPPGTYNAYSHAVAHPNERDRDIIVGGDGDDVIMGDSETWATYPPDLGVDTQDLVFWAPFYWEDGYKGVSATDNNLDILERSLDSELYPAFFYMFNPDNKFGCGDWGSEGPQQYDEIIFGGSGNDTIWGLGGNDWIQGGLDNDSLYGGTGHDLVEGGRGNDIVNVADAQSEYDAALGGIGDDTVTADLYDFADGGEGFDTLVIKNLSNADALFDFTQNRNGQSFTRNFEAFRYEGGSASDAVHGTGGAETILGGGGSDQLYGYGGADRIEGGAGIDYVIGGDGNDQLYGGAGSDVINDEAGDDFIDGGSEGDIIWTGTGNDTVKGGDGNDFIGEAIDGEDKQLHNPRTQAHDSLDGGRGHDRIFAGTGDDLVDGGADNDMIVGGLGYDQMRGGSGQDTFVWRSEDIDIRTLGTGETEISAFDKIFDLSTKDDFIDLTGLKEMTQDGKFLFVGQESSLVDSGEIVFAEVNGNIAIQVYLDNDSDVDLQIELAGRTFQNTSLFELESHILI